MTTGKPKRATGKISRIKRARKPQRAVKQGGLDRLESHARTLRRVVQGTGLALIAAELTPKIRAYRAMGRKAFQENGHYEARYSEAILPYLSEHQELLHQTTRLHGISGGLFTPRQQLTDEAWQRLCRFSKAAQTDLQWKAPRVPADVLVKVALHEDQPNAYWGNVKSAAETSNNEIVALRRLTAFGSRYAPKMYASCRFKLNRGWLKKPAYLTVVVMEALQPWAPRRIPVDWQVRLKNALEDLRACGILHYDLHEDNILWTGRTGIPKIIDYGYSVLLPLDQWTANVFKNGKYESESYYDSLSKATGIPRSRLRKVQNGDPVVARDLLINPDPVLWQDYTNTYKSQPLEANMVQYNANAAAARRTLLNAIRKSGQKVDAASLNALLPDVKAALNRKRNANLRISPE